MVIVALLDLPVELPPNVPARQAGHDTFMSGLPEYLSRCEHLKRASSISPLIEPSGQTFEGGISGSPGTEVHGAYAFCALACLCIMGSPCEMIDKSAGRVSQFEKRVANQYQSRYMDLPLLVSWLSARQFAPEGGFSGRTNKLVDGCYSYWVGGCWPLVQAALNGTPEDPKTLQPKFGSLYSREGLTRYILGCCQSPLGGLRDKPGKYVAGARSPLTFNMTKKKNR